MKQNEIMPRQNRVVYTLLVIMGALGLAWAIWKHWHQEETPAPAPHASVRAATWQRGPVAAPASPTQPAARA